MLKSALSSGESEGDELPRLSFTLHITVRKLEPETKHTLLTDSCFIRILVYGPLTFNTNVRLCVSSVLD